MCSFKSLASLCVLIVTSTVVAQKYDVVIAGAGSGGVAAAIQSARMGMNVALLEETEYIGGQMGSAGVSSMDEGNNLTPPSGLYNEFVANMEAYYLARHQTVNTCYWGSNGHCYEPVGIRSVLTSMIEDANRQSANGGHITLMLRERVISVQSKGKTVTGVTTQHHGAMTSAILVDATEWGDVIPMTPAAFRVSNQVGTPVKATCTQDITYTMVIKKYPDGVPVALQMKTPPPEYEKYVNKWRISLQRKGNEDNRWLPVGFAQHNAYRGMPNPGSDSYASTQPREITKTSINWFNDFPVDTGIFDRAKRQTYICEAKLKTIGNLYYFQHEMGEDQWSVADDQGYDTPYQREENLCPNIPAEYKAIERNMPQAAYVRESERVIGEETLTASDIRREAQGAVAVRRFPSSIAVGDYADDLHNCSSESNLEFDLERKSDDPPGFRSGPLQVPFGALIPKEVDGLLVAEKNLSVSRLANGATRLQPITMLTGQAVGALAAISVHQHIAPRAVNWAKLQVELLQSGSILASPPMHDMPIGTLHWQAAQFAVTHRWLETTKDGAFEPDVPLTRAQAVMLLAGAYDLQGPIGTFGPSTSRLKSSFSDVPLYNNESGAAEKLQESGAQPACAVATDKLCPKDLMSRTDFLRMAAFLERKQFSPVDNAVLKGQMRDDLNASITRGEAANVLYAAVRHRLDSKDALAKK